MKKYQVQYGTFSLEKSTIMVLFPIGTFSYILGKSTIIFYQLQEKVPYVVSVMFDAISKRTRQGSSVDNRPSPNSLLHLVQKHISLSSCFSVLMNQNSVCRTAPATPGLLMSIKKLDRPGVAGAVLQNLEVLVAEGEGCISAPPTNFLQ